MVVEQVVRILKTEFLSKIMKSVLRRGGYPLALIVAWSVSACGGGLPFPGLTVEEVYNLGVGALEEENWGDAARLLKKYFSLLGLIGCQKRVCSWQMLILEVVAI